MRHRRKRYDYAEQPRFITFSCDGRKPYLGNSESRDLFVEVLRSISQRYQFEVIGYVVMPEHVHLLLTPPKEKKMATAIQALKVSMSKRSAQKPFWLPHYCEFNIMTTPKIIEKLNYIHNNPVKRGLVPLPELWRWSSYSNPIFV